MGDDYQRQVYQLNQLPENQVRRASHPPSARACRRAVGRSSPAASPRSSDADAYSRQTCPRDATARVPIVRFDLC